MVMPFLDPSVIQMGDEEEAVWFSIDRGVAQGSHLSPGLYNIFMENICRSSGHCSEKKLQRTVQAICRRRQAIGHICGRPPLYLASKWVGENGMNKDTEKSVILRSKDTQRHKFILSGRVLKWVQEGST